MSPAQRVIPPDDGIYGVFTTDLRFGQANGTVYCQKLSSEENYGYLFPPLLVVGGAVLPVNEPQGSTWVRSHLRKLPKARGP